MQNKQKAKEQLTKELLHERFELRDGDLYYKQSKRNMVKGKKAGTNNDIIMINNKYYTIAEIKRIMTEVQKDTESPATESPSMPMREFIRICGSLPDYTVVSHQLVNWILSCPYNR